MKIVIYTQVYNAEKYIRQCIDSVLQQTYQNFELVLLDNGSTDGSKEILEEYARQNKKINLIRFEENILYPRWLQLVKENQTGDYLTRLDADDWLELDYLERLVHMAEQDHLDIVCTGTVMHLPQNGGESFRKAAQPILFRREHFAEGLPAYHAFFRTTWGKLIRMDCARTVSTDLFPPLVYGLDTLWSFQVLRRATRICIDSSSLYHYRVHPKSISYQYNPKRFDADIYLYNDAIDFLSGFGPVSGRNLQFLQAVYSNAIIDTSQVIHNSKSFPPEKLKEYRRIALHPLTRSVYRQCTDESALYSKNLLVQFAIEASTSLDNRSNDDLNDILQTLVPKCAVAIRPADLGLFLREPTLQKLLREDNREQLAGQILNLISQKRYTKQYDLGRILCDLIPDDCLLYGISDTRFFREYAESCALILGKKYSEALEQMTGILFQNKKLYAGEEFLNLYLTIAALGEEAPAFLFGKLRLAQLYLNQDRLPECRAIVHELMELGIENEELDILQNRLKETSE